MFVTGNQSFLVRRGFKGYCCESSSGVVLEISRHSFKVLFYNLDVFHSTHFNSFCH